MQEGNRSEVNARVDAETEANSGTIFADTDTEAEAVFADSVASSDTGRESADQEGFSRNGIESGPRRGCTAILMTVMWAALIAADLLSKTAAASALKGQSAIVLIPGVLELLYVENTGAAFSMLQNAQWLFILVAFLAITVIGVLLHRIPDSRRMRPMRCLLLLVSAGAAGNLVDRLLLGYVRDFIYFSLIDFPVFNVADIYVTCSVAVLAVLILFRYDDADFAFLERKKGTGAPS